jgi:hypothetical protein
MLDEFPPPEDVSVAPRFMSSWRHRFVFGLLILATGALGVVSFILIKRGVPSTYPLVTIIAAVILVMLITRSAQKIRISHALVGDILVVDKTNPKTKVSLRSYPRQYDLRRLLAAQKVAETNLQQDGYILPPKLVLIFDAEPGRRQQIVLQRPYVTRRAKDMQSFQRQLDSWDRVCSAIESEVLPRALALRWRTVPIYERYWFVLFQAEVEFLQGKSTAPQMCLATLRSIINIVRRGGSVLQGMWVWFILFYLFFGAIAFGSGWLGFRFFTDDANRLRPEFFWLFLPMFFVSAVYYILFLFEPLSLKVRKEMDTQAKQARRLIQAGLSADDLGPILSMLKHETDRVRHTLSTLTLATALSALITSLPKFFGASTSRISDSILAVSVVAFAIVQLYYFAQVRILHIAQTSCLIAQGELGKART